MIVDLRVIKPMIVEIVQDKQGCKATEIPTELLLRVRSYPRMLEMLEQLRAGGLVDAIDELVYEGSLIEVTYELADMPEKTKMFLLPAGTKAHIRAWRRV